MEFCEICVFTTEMYPEAEVDTAGLEITLCANNVDFRKLNLPIVRDCR